MATLILGAVGTLVAGPVGGAIGALAGRQLDAQIIGNGSREGPRLKELAVTTSSYGAALPRHYGRMRVAGTIIWATELRESRETSGGGKGKPKTTQYSYSMSFAVALASRPIAGIGRIWADGNLLRGAAGDLKVGGTMRVHRGFGDQLPDPVIASDRGMAQCPAFRDCAYVVFEDLQLGDFGNRIPALTFELLAGDTALDTAMMVAGPSHGTGHGTGNTLTGTMPLPQLTGFSHESGTIADMLDTIGMLYPFSIDAGGAMLRLRPDDRDYDNDNDDTNDGNDDTDIPLTLPAPSVASSEDDFGTNDGQRRERGFYANSAPNMLRYYDVARDYQPGVQRVSGQRVGGQNDTGAERVIQFPGALQADAARGLLSRAARRVQWSADRLRWRASELDGRITPGSIVRVPDDDDGARWIVEEWEWRENGVELDLRRLPPPLAGSAPLVQAGDSGSPLTAPDLIAGPTVLRALELPWDGAGDGNTRRVHIAAGSASTAWRGASLFRDGADGLEPIGQTGREMSAIGRLTAPLPCRPVRIVRSVRAIESWFWKRRIQDFKPRILPHWQRVQTSWRSAMKFCSSPRPGRFRKRNGFCPVCCAGAAGPNIAPPPGTMPEPVWCCWTIRCSSGNLPDCRRLPGTPLPQSDLATIPRWPPISVLRAARSPLLPRSMAGLPNWPAGVCACRGRAAPAAPGIGTISALPPPAPRTSNMQSASAIRPEHPPVGKAPNPLSISPLQISAAPGSGSAR